MEELTTKGKMEAFFSRLGSAGERLLLLDYDGTLAPFRVNRNEAVPYDGLRPIIERLAGSDHTRVVVISGRAVEDLLPLLGMDPAPEIFGAHGWERRHANGEIEQYPLPPRARQALHSAREWIETQGFRDRSENKAASVTLHWRGLPEAEQTRLEQEATDAWAPLAGRDEMELHHFDGGLEIRAVGRNKGDAAQILIDELSDPANAAIAYLGDDTTDEDAFEALGDGALRVLVRGEPRETAADVWIVPPEELFDFLRRWDHAASPTQ